MRRHSIPLITPLISTILPESINCDHFINSKELQKFVILITFMIKIINIYKL
jgi:hypothetical protein